MDFPFVSIIIPCRNEKKFIAECLDSVIAQDYPQERLEILVVDGRSEDGTLGVVKEYSTKYLFIRALDNPQRIVSSAMNTGIREARGEVIVRMDAHSVYERNYVSNCVRHLSESGVDNVGGLFVTLPADDTSISNAIAYALSHPFGVGNSYFRIGSSEPRLVDTVPFGCYKREVFERIGFFDEDLIRNQDDEFNHRLIKNGGKVLLVPEIVSYYHARDSLAKLFRMYYQYGYFKPLAVRKLGSVLTWRQLMPSLLIVGVIASFVLSFIFKPFKWPLFLVLSLYLAANLGFSFYIAAEKGLKYILTLPFAFLTLHAGYGIGYLKGMWDFFILKKHTRKKVRDMPLTR